MWHFTSSQSLKSSGRLLSADTCVWASSASDIVTETKAKGRHHTTGMQGGGNVATMATNARRRHCGHGDMMQNAQAHHKDAEERHAEERFEDTVKH